MNSSILKKVTHERNYTIIDNGLLRNPNLSMKAKGLACYLLSLPADWKINQRELTKHFTDGLSAVNSTMGELKLAGYVLIAPTKDATGKILHWNTYIREDLSLPWPVLTPDVENPHVENPDVENPHILNTNITNDLSETNKHIAQENKKQELGMSKEEYQEVFDNMWQRYPLKKGKQKALAAFWKLFTGKHWDRELILCSKVVSGFMAHLAEREAKQQLKSQGADIWVPELPHLSTWLNDKRWEDEYQTPEQILQTAHSKPGIIDIDKVFGGDYVQ